MQRLFVTGASGFLGWYVANEASKEWEVHGTRLHHAAHSDAIFQHQIDLTEIKQVVRLLEYLKPEAIVHTAAYTDANYCQQHPEQTALLNTTFTQALAEWAEKQGSIFCFTSTDLVFDGKKGNYKETDTTNPLSEYGRQKAAAEQAVLGVYPEALVVRMPLMLGHTYTANTSYLQTFLEQLKAGNELGLFTDEFRSPIGVKSAAKGILQVLKQASGILHLGGPERMSRYELGMCIAEVLGLNANIVARKQSDVPMPAPRPADVSLDSSKAKTLGFNPKNLREELKNLQIKA